MDIEQSGYKERSDEKMALPTNYKDDVLGDSMGGKRRYRMIENSDGTVSFDDVTEYTQFGSNFGAKQINETNEAVNKSVKNTDIIDTENGIKENAESGKVAGALAVKKIAESKQDKIEKSLQTSDGKVGMRSDNEGGNFFLKSKNGKHWEADAYNDNLRVYYEDGAIAFTFSNDGSMNIADLVISSVTTRMSEFIRKIKSAAYCTVVNNATTTGAGTVLDGRMGKTLMDRLLQDSSLLQTVLNNLIRSDKTIGSAYAVTATYRSNAYLTTVYWSGTHVGDKMAAYTQRNFGTLPAGHRPNAKCQVPVAGIPGLYLTVEPSGVVSMRNEHYAEISFSKVSVYGALTFIN